MSDNQTAKVEIIHGSHKIDTTKFGQPCKTLAQVVAAEESPLETPIKGMPTLMSGKLEPKTRNNPLKCSLLISDNELNQLIENIDKGFEVNLYHLVRTTIVGSANGKKQLTRFLAPKIVKIDGTNHNKYKTRNDADPLNAEPDWNKEKHPVPLKNQIVNKNEIVVGHYLIMNDLTVNQVATLVLKAPQFVLQSCCYLDADKNIRPIKDITTMFKVYLLKKIQHYNNWLKYKAMDSEQKKALRQQIKDAKELKKESTKQTQIEGVVVKCEQFQIDMSSDQILEGVNSGSTSNSVVGRIGLSADQESGLVVALDFNGTPENPIITVISAVAAKSFTFNDFYKGVPNPPTMNDEVKKGDYEWVKEKITDVGKYNLMVKPIWMEGITFDNVFHDISLDEIKAKSNAKMKECEEKVDDEIKNDGNLGELKNAIAKSDLGALTKRQEMMNDEYNKWEELWKVEYLQSIVNNSNGKVKSNDKIKIPCFNMYDVNEIAKFNAALGNALNGKEMVVDEHFKIGSNLISKDQLRNIWQSINVLHRTVKARVRSFKI